MKKLFSYLLILTISLTAAASSGCVGTPAGDPAKTPAVATGWQRAEAETAAISNLTRVEDTNASGGCAVSAEADTENSLTFSVSSAQDKPGAKIRIFYSVSAEGTPAVYELSGNGTRSSAVFPAGERKSYSDFTYREFALDLMKGENKITLLSVEDSGAIVFDCLDVETAPADEENPMANADFGAELKDGEIVFSFIPLAFADYRPERYVLYRNGTPLRTLTNADLTLSGGRASFVYPALDNLLSNAEAYEASSVFDNTGTYDARFAFDGDSGTRWSAAEKDLSSSWLSVQFDAPRTIDTLLLREPFEARVTSFTVEYRNGTEWKRAVSGNGIGSTAKLCFKPFTAEEIRFNFGTSSIGTISDIAGYHTASLYDGAVYRLEADFGGGVTAEGPSLTLSPNTAEKWAESSVSAEAGKDGVTFAFENSVLNNSLDEFRLYAGDTLLKTLDPGADFRYDAATGKFFYLYGSENLLAGGTVKTSNPSGSADALLDGNSDTVWTADPGTLSSTVEMTYSAVRKADMIVIEDPRMTVKGLKIEIRSKGGAWDELPIQIAWLPTKVINVTLEETIEFDEIRFTFEHVDRNCTAMIAGMSASFGAGSGEGVQNFRVAAVADGGELSAKTVEAAPYQPPRTENVFLGKQVTTSEDGDFKDCNFRGELAVDGFSETFWAQNTSEDNKHSIEINLHGEYALDTVEIGDVFSRMVSVKILAFVDGEWTELALTQEILSKGTVNVSETKYRYTFAKVLASKIKFEFVSVREGINISELIGYASEEL